VRQFLIAMLTASVLLLGAYLAVAEAPTPRTELLADRHVATGLACASCHGATRPADVPIDTCLTCHVSYADLARRTAGRSRNPHDSHYPNLECTTRHHGHQKSEDFCAGCHGPS
jgi:hypothetical protein